MRCPVRSEDCDVSAKDLFTFAFFYTLSRSVALKYGFVKGLCL